MTLLTATTRVAPTSRRLRAAMGCLLLTDLAGGLLAVASGLNTWGEAWGARALLAAPLPMIGAQLLLTWLATRRATRGAAVAAGLLAAACLVSVASGFFDGGLADERLTGPLRGFQVLLLGVTGTVGVLAAARARAVTRHGIRS